jgi:SOS-response transcriptional repressor LexA
MVTVLSGLRRPDGDFRRLSKAEGLVSILWGAIRLGQSETHSADYYFEQGARRLRHWGYEEYESLAYFGRALASQQEREWDSAFEAAQEALDAIGNVPVRDETEHTRRLKQQIGKEIDAITLASTNGTASASPTERTVPIRPPRRSTLIPIVRDIAAGIGVIAEENVEEYLSLDEGHSNGADFGVRVVGDSMSADGILPSDIALIRVQPAVETGEIAAIVINVPAGSEGVLKRYYRVVNEEQPNLEHYLLKSSNPQSEHLVVIPSGTNVNAVKSLYAREIRSGRMRHQPKYYEDTSLIVAGKCVGLVRTI